MYFGFWPAKILSYDQASHTAQVHIAGLTDGLTDGITADFAYPVGDDDKDTERLITLGADVDVYFERGQPENPVIAFYRSHRAGGMKDIRRIRQKNIELLATQRLYLKAPNVVIDANVTINGDITHTGDQTTTGTITGSTDVVGAGKSLASHLHLGVKGGNDTSGMPQ